MPEKLVWSERRDCALRRMRGAGCSWDAIAAVLHISRNAVIERGRRLGARLPPRVAAQLERDEPNRPPLRAGHPVSWAVLVQGTMLSNEPYPPPQPIGRRYQLAVG